MKLAIAMMASVEALSQERAIIRTLNQARAEKRMRFPADRFIYQYPMCDSIEQCVADHDQCDGQVFTSKTGEISHRGYSDFFNCQWQIHAPEGKTVGLKFYNDFDLEYHKQCGWDRVHIRCLDDPAFDAKGGKPISRLCGPLNTDNTWAYDALKMMPKKSFFKESTDTGCQRVLIEFNTDQDTQGQTERTGFTLGFYHTKCKGDNCPDDVCADGNTAGDVMSCLIQGANKAVVDEYENQIAAASGKTRAKLERTRDIRIANAEGHVGKYATKMLQTVSRCGKGLTNDFDAAFYPEMRDAVASGSAEQMFAIWNKFAVGTLTGDGVSCGWYNGSGDEAIEESSFPCRTRRLFLKMLGRTQYGQYEECNAAAFDINTNTLFR